VTEPSFVADVGMSAAAVLAATFAWAGAAKLAAPGGVPAGFAALGLPRPALLAKVVPFVELALAVLLVAAPAAGGLAAFWLLGAFTSVLLRALRRGVAVPGACFGQPTGPPLSRAEVVRNFLLQVAALVALGAGATHLPRPAAAVATLLAVGGGWLAVRALRPRHEPGRAGTDTRH
jgi:protein-S-isoprenylcysteine O-methyltransferase Ste14